MRQVKRNGLLRKLLTAAVAACFAGELAYANPVGPAVVNGQASFATQGKTLSVTNTPGAIINWQQFSINANEATRFIQQSAASAVLNRVVGVDPSRILGTLQSNGRVFLINPNGILFGAGAQIDVGGLVASTLKLSNEDFIAGRMHFIGDPGSAAAVINQGRITAAEGARVYLIGSAVDNQGVITAPNGDIVLAAGKSVRVAEASSQGVQVEILALADRTLNVSELVYSPRGIYAGLVRNSGVIRADSVVRAADGSITLKASHDVALESGSHISANGLDGGRIVIEAQQGTAAVAGTVAAMGSAGRGGSIAITGDHTGLFDDARIDATGTSGGGTVLIGGDVHGVAIRDGELALSNSQRTYVAPSAQVRADALESGDGGTVVIWADDITRFYGSVSVRGGAQGGNGGFVETSGKRLLDARGYVDASAPLGSRGEWLLDPHNIVVANAGAGLLTDVDQFTDTPASDVTIAPATINAAGANVILQANNDITFTDAVSITGAGISLTAQAGRSIVVNANVSTNNASITFTANETTANGVVNANRNAGAAAITMAAGTTLASGGGNITLTLNTGAGLTNSTSGDITIEGVNAGSGHFLVANNGPTAGSDILRASATELVTATSATFDVNGAGGGGRIGTGIAPMGVSVTNLEARSQSGGAFFNSPTLPVNIGGATLGGLTGISTSANGAISVTTAGTSITTTEAISANSTGTVTISAGTGAYNQNDVDITSGSGAITITADAVNIAANTGNNAFQTTGALTLQPGTAATNMSLAGASSFDLTGAEVTDLAGGVTGAGTINIGNAGASTGVMNIGAAVSFGAKTVTFNAGSFTDGGIFPITAGNLTLNARNAAGAIGSTAAPIDVAVTNLRLLTAGGGNAFINSPGGGFTFGIGATTVGAGRLDVVATGTTNQTQVVTANTLTGNLSGAASALNLNGVNNAITNLGISGGVGITAPGGFALTNGNNNVNVNGVVTTTNSPITVSAGTGTFRMLSATSAFITGSGAITTTSNTFAINSTVLPGTFQTSGAVTLQPFSAATTMSLAGGGGTFNLVPSEIAEAVGGITGSITIGNAGASTGLMTIAGPLNFGPITATINAGSITDGGNVRVITARDLNLNAINVGGAIGAAGVGAIDVAVTNLTVKTNNSNAFITSASGFNLGFGATTSSVGTGQLNLNVTAGGSITQSTAVTANTLTATLAGGASALNLNTVNNNVANIGAITAPAGFRVTNGNNPTTITGLIDSSGNNGPVTISTGTGAYNQNDFDILSGSGAITITADAVNIAANTGNNAFQTIGALTLQSSTAAINMSLAGVSPFDLTAAEVTDLAGGVTGAGTIKIGNTSASAGVMNIGAAVSFGAKRVTLDAGSFTDGGVFPITATNLALNAHNAIGAIGSLAAPIDTAVTNLTFNTVNQDAFVNSAGAINIGPGISAVGAGNIVLTAGGAVTQSAGGGITSSGTTTVAAGAANNIALNAAGNDFGAVAITSGNNVTLVDANAFNLRASTVSGTLNVTANGAITDAGNLVVTGTTTLAAGVVNNIILDSAGNDFSTVAITSANNVTLNDTNALNFGNATVAGTLTAIAGGTITLNGTVSASGAGDSITLAAGGNFINNVGAAALNPGAGRFLIYSTDPALDTRGGLAYNFKQYDATFGITPVLGTGNGFLYTIAPSITPSLSGSVTKVYDGTLTAPLAAGNYTVSGVIDGDTVTLNNPLVGSYDTRDVGVNKNVSVSGLSIESATDGAASVFGYQLGSTTANANIGETTVRAVTVTAQSDIKGYDGNGPSAVAPLITTGSLAPGDASGFFETFNNKNVGTGKTLTASGAVLDGNSGNNYAVSFVLDVTGVIMARAITVTAQTDTKSYDGTTTSAAVPLITSGGLALGDTSGFLETFNNKNVGVGKTLTAGGIVNDGNAGANYTVSFVTDTTGVITGRAITVTANDQSKAFNTTFIFTGNEFTSTGLQGGETIGRVTLASAGAPATATVAGSPYGITASTPTGGSFAASNYNISFAPGALTVIPVISGGGNGAGSSVGNNAVVKSLNADPTADVIIGLDKSVRTLSLKNENISNLKEHNVSVKFQCPDGTVKESVVACSQAESNKQKFRAQKPQTQKPALIQSRFGTANTR